MKALLKISEFQKITLLAVIFLLSFVFIALALFFPEVSHAAFEYKPLQPIQELGISGDKPELSSYLNSIFMGGIILAGVLAVVMITIGGFQYMSTDSIFGKSEGRQKILAAIGGLILALAAWLILNTINPKLVRQQIALDTIRPSGTVLATPVIPGGSATPSPAAGGNTGTGEWRKTGNTVTTLEGRTITPQTFPNKTWEEKALELVKNSQLPNLTPADADKYFPNGQVTAEGWVHLIGGIIKKESDFNTRLEFPEGFVDKDGNEVVSTGLLQLSYNDGPNYGMPNYTTEQLKDPDTNLALGVKIMEKLVQQDGVIAGKNGNAWKGLPRYWSTTR